MTLDQATQIVQMAYPQVYLACHTRHQRKRTTVHKVSERDSAILAHLSQRTASVPIKLAAHLAISRSTLSEALKRLSHLGYVVTIRRGSPAQQSGVYLTEQGARVIADTSVLEASRLNGVLSSVTPSERRAVATGLNLLAKASREWSARQPRSKNQA